MLLHKALVLSMKMLHVLLTCCAALVVGAVYADAGVRCELVLMLRMQKWRAVCCMPLQRCPLFGVMSALLQQKCSTTKCYFFTIEIYKRFLIKCK